MNEFDIHIETLPPMRVTYFKAFSQHPEVEASWTLWAWAELVGIIIELHSVRRSGFNNPPPWDTPGPAYGYESWITVDPDVNPIGEIRVKRFPGSLCALTSIEKLSDIGTAWKYLYQWCQGSDEYEHAHLDGLEEVLRPVGTPEEHLRFNLWLPIRKK